MRVLFRFLTLVFLWLLSPSVFAKEIKLDASVFDSGGLAFKSHSGDGPFDSYLTMDVPFKPVKHVYDSLKKTFKLPLITRGEAHITVITPVENRPHLESKLSIDEIDEIAQREQIQKAKYQIVGLGSGSATVEGKREETFFIVVKSEDLLKIRSEIKKRFVEKGGDPKVFDSEKYYPHITVGFTKNDLHESDGVIKDERSLDKRVELKLKPRK